MSRALLAASCSLALVACRPDNGLWGSLADVFPLESSRIELVADAQALQLTYLINRGSFVDVVARVSVKTSDLTLKHGLRVPLQGATDDGVLRCVVAHAPGGEPVRLLPPIQRGDLFLGEGGRPGDWTRGDFSVLFAGAGGDLGQGRTLSGTFSGLAGDDHPSTIVDATPLTLGAWGKAGELQFDGDEDVFGFSVTGATLALRVELTGVATRVAVERHSGEPVLQTDAGVAAPAVFTGPGAFPLTLPEAGQYALRVGEIAAGALGAYTVRVVAP